MDPNVSEGTQAHARALVAEMDPRGDQRIATDLVAAALGLIEDDPDSLDLKIAAAAMTEMREAFGLFAALRDIPKVTVFGSARTQPHDPLYEQATRIAAALAGRGWMVITGAGPGIMQAAMEGAGRARSIGVAIRLPFEQGANPVIAGDEKYVSMKYFFTRKLMLIKESRAFVCLPGGFGTLDETFELLTLTQTGKGLPVPIVLLDAPGDPFWERIDEMVREQLVGHGFVSPSDTGLYLVTDSTEAAAAEIDRFYLNYHSIRYVGDFLIVRLRHPITDQQLAELNERFGHLVARGRIERTGPLDIERRHGDHVELPRIRFAFRRHRPGDLRALIDALNGFVAPSSVRATFGPAEALAHSDGDAAAGPRSGRQLTEQDGGLLHGPPGLGQRAVLGRTLRGPVGDGLLAARSKESLVELAGRSPSSRLAAELLQVTPLAHRARLARTQRLGDEVDGVADVEAGGPQVHRAPGVGAGDDRRAGPGRRPGDRRHLAVAHRGGQRRLQRRVRATGPAAQPLVVELDDVGDVAEQGPHRHVGPLDVAQVAGVLDDHRAEAAGRRGEPIDAGGEPLVDVEHAGRERRRLGRAEEVAVVLHRRAAPGRVDDDRRLAGHRAHRALGEPAGGVAEPGVHVQRPAARTGRSGTANVDPASVISAAVDRWVRASRRPSRSPVNNQTSSPVGRTAGPRRSGRRDSPARRGTRRRRWATARTEDPASSVRWRPSTENPARSHRGAVRCSSASAVAGALHEVPERDAARARRLAAAALDARLHEPHELAVGLGAAPLHGPHRVDATARREGLLPRDAERRAVRQAQPAGDARRELLVVEVQVDRTGHGIPT